jgi:uncharacterized protein YjbJ (UPF0337 family)
LHYSKFTSSILPALFNLRQKRKLEKPASNAGNGSSERSRSWFLTLQYSYRITGYTASRGWIPIPPAVTVKFIRRIPQRRNFMKQSSKDQAKGKLHQVKGKIKAKLGRATRNPNLETEGEDELVVGTVQKKIGQIEKVFEE